MARWANITIAGVSLKSAGDVFCRADFVDAEALKGARGATNTVALDFSVHTQTGAHNLSGVAFGVRVYQLPVSKLNAIVAAIEAAYSDGEDFAVTGADGDGVDDIDVRARLEYQAGKPYTRGTFSGGLIRDINFRFVSAGPNE